MPTSIEPAPTVQMLSDPEGGTPDPYLPGLDDLYPILSEGVLASDRRTWTVALRHRRPLDYPDVPPRMDLVRECALTFEGGDSYGDVVVDGAAALRVIDPTGIFLRVLRSTPVETDLLVTITAESGGAYPLRYGGYVRTKTVRRGRHPEARVPTVDFRLYDGLSGVGGQQAVRGADTLGDLLLTALKRLSDVAGLFYASGLGADGDEDPRLMAMPAEQFEADGSVTEQLGAVGRSLGCRIYQDVRLGGAFMMRRRRRIGADEPQGWLVPGGLAYWGAVSVSASRAEPPEWAFEGTNEDVLVRRLGDLAVQRSYEAAAPEDTDDDVRISLVRDPDLQHVGGTVAAWQARRAEATFSTTPLTPAQQKRIGTARRAAMPSKPNDSTGESRDGLWASGQLVGAEQWLSLSAYVRGRAQDDRYRLSVPVRILLRDPVVGALTHAYVGQVQATAGYALAEGSGTWESYTGLAEDAPASLFEQPRVQGDRGFFWSLEHEWRCVGGLKPREDDPAGGPLWERRVVDGIDDVEQPEDEIHIGEPQIIHNGSSIDLIDYNTFWLENAPDAPDHQHGPTLTPDLDDAYWWWSRTQWSGWYLSDQDAQDVRFETVTQSTESGGDVEVQVGVIPLGPHVGYHKLIAATRQTVGGGSASYQAKIKARRLPAHGQLFVTLATAGSVEDELQPRETVPVTVEGEAVATPDLSLDFDGADSGTEYVATVLEYVRWPEYPPFLIPPPPRAGRVEVEFMQPFGDDTTGERYDLAAPRLELVDGPGGEPVQEWEATLLLDPERPEAYRQSADLPLVLGDVALTPGGSAYSAVEEWTDRYGTRRGAGGGFEAATGLARPDLAELLALDRLSQQREDAWLVEGEVAGFYPPGTSLVLADGEYVPVQVECQLAPSEVTKGIWRRLPPEEVSR